MNAFQADWLTLREAVDSAARAQVLEQLLAHHLTQRETLRIVDLGCGTGSNLRHLALRLPQRQIWHLADADPALLDAIPGRLRPWAERHRLRMEDDPGALVLSGEGRSLRVERHTVDLARHPLPRTDVDLVTASALLDLVSRVWLAALAARCAEVGAAALLTLSYDGRIAWEPGLPEDETIRTLVNRHQQGDKSFGPALGPEAHTAALAAFRAAGFTVSEAASDWRLDAGQAALQQHLHAGWAAAAAETDPARLEQIHGWLAQRMDLLETGQNRVSVGHMDLLALPA